MCNLLTQHTRDGKEMFGKIYLNHSRDKLINSVFTISEITSFDEMVVLFAPTACRCVELEGPDEVVYLLEDASAGVNLINHIFNALDIIALLQFTLNHEVVSDGDTATSMLKNINKLNKHHNKND